MLPITTSMLDRITRRDRRTDYRDFPASSRICLAHGEISTLIEGRSARKATSWAAYWAEAEPTVARATEAQIKDFARNDLNICAS